MKSRSKSNRLQITGSLLILGGALSIFMENDTALHTTLQIVFVVGCLTYIIGGKLAQKARQAGVVALFFLAIPSLVSAQDYREPIRAFEKSFHEKDISVIQPYLSDSLRFKPLPVQNTLPVLTNILTKLPQLEKLQLLKTEKGKALVAYSFQQLGVRESAIWFNRDGKIFRIELVENLIQQEMEQQRKLRASVQAPQPGQLSFDFSKKTIEFPSLDGLLISADWYEIDPSQPVILLCHQAGHNKYEYADIAPRLNKLGYNALALDQRSGGSFAGMPNETFQRAQKGGSEDVAFTDALPDIKAAIDYLYEKYQKPIILWGSSYSSSLILHIAQNNPKVKAVISFSPGDYFGDKLPSLKTVFPNLEQPFFITSSKEEAPELKALCNPCGVNKLQWQFIPEAEGFHGSRALWLNQKGSQEYWNALHSFFEKVNNL